MLSVDLRKAASGLSFSACTFARVPVQLFRPHLRKYGARTLQGQHRRPSQLLPEAPARTRFAPSPTGYLHLGSLRTALYNYLLAKATGGQFILRIEDTDTKRTVPDAEERICRDLEWAGLHWDEGPKVGGSYAPYRQSERTELYRKHADELLSLGYAYRCFCSSQRLDQLAQSRSQLGLPVDYDRACFGISQTESDERASKGEKHTIRLKSPEVAPEFTDLVYGKVGGLQSKGTRKLVGTQGYEDPILVKSDGLPTYHLANVVDDHYMNITHVIRAVEWMSSTPKHLAMYHAFGWRPPAYAHVGLLQDKSGQKLSKRNADVDLQSFKEQGIFPEALLNYVALLGWSHGQKSDLMPLDYLIKNFDLKFTKGNTIVTFEKLSYLQKQYAKRYIENDTIELDRMVHAIRKELERDERSIGKLYVPRGQSLDLYIISVLKADSKQYYSPQTFYTRNQNFFVKTLDNLPQLTLTVDDPWKIATAARSFSDLPEAHWNENDLQRKQREIVESIKSSRASTKYEKQEETSDNLSVAKEITSNLSRYLRWAVMGSQPGPPMAMSMELLGRENSLLRLESAEKKLKDHLGFA